METWALSKTVSPRRADMPMSLLDGELAGIVESIGEPGFARRALDCVDAAVGVDFWSVYRVHPDRPPQMFLSASRKGKDVSGECFRCYRAGLYRDDRTLTGARNLARPGAPAMTLWNEAEIPSPHRDQIYRRHSIRERLSVVSGATDGGFLAINLYRHADRTGYRGRDIDAAQCLARSLMAAVCKHVQWIGKPAEQATGTEETLVRRLRERCPTLTPRELDVCVRLLRGLTYEGIASDLGLSLPSVKTYRARAFDRLGVHFRSELFALALDSE